MQVQRLAGIDGFVVFDLAPGAEPLVATGIARHGEKILIGSATEYARAVTYGYALLNVKRGGASAGVNSPPADRDAAVIGFVDAIAGLGGSYLPDPGKGLSAADLAPLAESDPRTQIDTAAVVAAAAAAAATAAGVDLSGARVAIEGYTQSSSALVAELHRHGAQVVAVATERFLVADKGGLSAEQLAQAADGLAEGDPANRVFGVAADVLFAGSKLGAVSNVAAGFVKTKAVVPTSPSPFTAKSYAILRKAGVEAVPDFAVLAGVLHAQWTGALPAEAAKVVADLITDCRRDADGVYLGACYRAESFLRTWQQKLPFGRPFAS